MSDRDPRAIIRAPHRACPVSSLDSIRRFLARTRSLVYRREGARWTLWALVACAGLALIAPACALVLVGTRATAVAILATAGLCAAIAITAAITLGAIVPRRRWKSDARMACYVGDKVAPLRSDLLSAVELAGPLGGPGAPSSELVTALVGATATRVATMAPETLVPRAPVTQAAWALAGVVALHGAVLAVAPTVVEDGWRRLVTAPRRPFDGAALSPVPLVGDLQLELVYPPYTRRAPTVLPSTTGDFRALPGTQVTITTRALTAATRGELILEPTDGSEPIAIPLVDPDASTDPAAPARAHATLRGRFAVTTPARYRFQLEDAQHTKVIEATPHQLELEVDQAPTVQLYAPADELDVTAMKRVELAYVIEDDFGVASAELVWETGRERGRRPVPITAPGASGRAQGKLVWDLAEVPLPPGAEITYHLEAKDTDSVRGPNVGVSRAYKLRVWSPRQRHEQSLARQQETAEKVVASLGGRLTLDPDDLDAREQLHKQGAEIVVELGTLVAAYRDDAMADKALPKALEAMRGRLDKLVVAEGKILERLPRPAGDRPKGTAPRFVFTDRGVIAELEDDAIALADWIDREQMEGLLDVADELATHQRRLAELMDQYAKTGDPKLKAEIERELRTIDGLLGEIAQKRGGMAEDVLDQFVHADALTDQRADGCLDEVQRLFAAGDTAGAQAQLARCGQRLDDATAAMEQSLGQLRGDKFGESEKKLDELMNDLTDLAADQRAIASATDELFQRYAERADRLMEDRARDARRRLQGEVDRLRERIDDIPEAGLTPFAKEELDIVRHRLTDLDQMLGDGDIAEALGMARQAKQSLDTIAAELEAAIDDDPRSPWARETADALEATERALPATRKLVAELEELSPSPDQILTPDDRRQLEQLRRRQHDTKDRAQRLTDKAKAAGPELPGAAGDEIAKRVGEARGRMTSAEGRLGARDPSGAREDARAAADALDKARERARGAARQQQAGGQGATGDQPIRIPGADEYRAPETFREDILEAMKRKAPQGYDDLVRRYYQELIR